MAGIKISKSLKSKLPEEQRENIEENLWIQCGGKCFLCGEELNRANDDIAADHDDAEIEDGPTSIENLNLVHKSCNSAKKNNPTVEIQQYLRLQAFIKKNSGKVKYGECTKHFGITPKPVVVSFPNPTEIKIELPDGKIATSKVYSTTNSGGTFRYTFVEVPRDAIFNDDECQPRNIKLPQVWAIYVDLQKNPLHEPPGCRLETVSGETRLAMFDGQHKTVASWMSGQQTIVIKLYLDLSTHQTIRLVNSVQAKIKKLPLSPFEIAAKLADEWQGLLGDYEAQVDAEKVSEQGFITWLKPTDRARGKQAFEAARIQNILEIEDFSLLRFVKKGAASDEDLIPEAAFKARLLKEMIHVKPLSTPGEEGQVRRAREAENIVKTLNHFASIVFEPNGEGIPLSDSQKETRKRFVYQASLKFVGEMLKKAVAMICLKDAEIVFLDANYSEDQWSAIKNAIERLTGHPIWAKDFQIGPKAMAVDNAMQKNQGAKEALGEVGLTIGYIMGGESLSGSWFK